MTKITLRPGDYVRTEGMTEEQYHAVAKAFMAAGAEHGEYGCATARGDFALLGWGAASGKICHWNKPGSFGGEGDELTIDQILGTEPDADGWIEWHGGECPVEKGVLVDVRYRDGVEGLAMPALKEDPRHESGRLCMEWGRKGYRSDIIAYRIHQPEQEQAPMTIEQLLAKANKHAAKAAKHEAKRHALFLQAAEMVPEGYALREKVGGEMVMTELCDLFFLLQSAEEAGESGHPSEVMRKLGIPFQWAEPMPVADRWRFNRCAIPVGMELPSYLESVRGKGEGQDMTDPANWKAGDVVESTRKVLNVFSEGVAYVLASDPDAEEGEEWMVKIHKDDQGDECYSDCTYFRWISRPQ